MDCDCLGSVSRRPAVRRSGPGRRRRTAGWPLLVAAMFLPWGRGAVGETPAASSPSSALSSEGVEADLFVLFERGTLPIILSAPHDGTLPLPDTPPRRGQGVAQFQTVRDTDTAAIARRTAQRLQEHLRGRVWLVVARCERRYVDVNRPAELAYESPAGRQVYERYHAALREACREVRRRYAAGLLLDIHGQGQYPQAICRGTNDGRTVERLIERYGWGAITGRDGLLGGLQRRGYTILPDCQDRPNSPNNREVPQFRGGYIVRTYSGEWGIDAVQLEVGVQYRQDGRWRRLADDLADAVAVFAESYLPLRPRP